MPSSFPLATDADVASVVPCPVAYLDAEHRCTRVNVAWARLTGHASDAAQGQSLFEVLHADDHGEVRAALEALGSSAPASSSEAMPPAAITVRVRRADGTLRWAEFAAQPYGPEGEAVITLYDVTEHHAERQRLEAAYRAAAATLQSRASFLALLNHKLRTPLAGIMSMASLMTIKLPDAYQEYAASIERSGHSLLAMLNALVAHARLESGDPSHFQRIRVVDVVEMLTYEARTKAEKRGLTLQTPTAPEAETARLHTEPNAFELAVSSVLENAILHTTEGTVTVAVTAGPGTISIQITDQGPGLDAELLQALQTPGFPTTPAARDALSGRGVGLALAYQFVGLMGGHITVESTPETGTAFTLTFPRDDT